MIYLSYGMPKSASSYCYQLADVMLKQAGYVKEKIWKNYLPEKFHQVYMELNNDEIFQLVECVPENEILIVKTHTYLSDAIDLLLKSGKIKASASFRDPRDAAISVLEAGENDRKIKKFRRFHEIGDLDDAFMFYKEIKDSIIPWLSHPHVLKISYNLLALNPIEAASRIRNHLQIKADIGPVVEKFSGNLQGDIWEFNKGQIGRYKEYMNEMQKQRFSLEFKELILLMNELDDIYQIERN